MVRVDCGGAATFAAGMTGKEGVADDFPGAAVAAVASARPARVERAASLEKMPAAFAALDGRIRAIRHVANARRAGHPAQKRTMTATSATRQVTHRIRTPATTGPVRRGGEERTGPAAGECSRAGAPDDARA